MRWAYYLALCSGVNPRLTARPTQLYSHSSSLSHFDAIFLIVIGHLHGCFVFLSIVLSCIIFCYCYCFFKLFYFFEYWCCLLCSMFVSLLHSEIGLLSFRMCFSGLPNYFDLDSTFSDCGTCSLFICICLIVFWPIILLAIFMQGFVQNQCKQHS